MITDIKSFNYNKVGKKQGEYFGEEHAKDLHLILHEKVGRELVILNIK